MLDLRSALLFGLGVAAGGMIAVQSVLNATLGERLGNFGSVFALTVVSIIVLLLIIGLFPRTAHLSSMPGISEWYLYAGGVLGVIILAAPIVLVPRVGVAITLITIVMGQLLASLVIDHFGLFSSPRIAASYPRIIGIIFVALGAILSAR